MWRVFADVRLTCTGSERRWWVAGRCRLNGGRKRWARGCSRRRGASGIGCLFRGGGELKGGLEAAGCGLGI